MRHQKLLNLTFGTSIMLASAFLFAFAVAHSAEAQQWNSMDFGDGWVRHSFSDGTTGYSTHMDDGWYRHSFSDGTTGYSDVIERPKIRNYGGGIHLQQWKPRTYMWDR